MTSRIYNNEHQYGGLSRFYHWTMAILFIGMMACGLIMVTLDNGTVRDATYMLHKTVGITILLLGIFRLVWIRHSKTPKPDESLETWEKLLAKWGHRVLYIVLLGMPISGLGMVYFFGNVIEYIVPLNEVGEPSFPTVLVFAYLHKFILPPAVYIVVTLHIIGVIKHVIVDKKPETLTRMIGKIER
ncbi:cytochrome b [uncultured Pseudoteredinibacter sp.]|uniref:cytochrome b n=1 Tax=uncultured Pseudoteredinibacter sp. TaxID=1641701 RepID=UPI0026238259|nr:cytochrome b [uncultured Pseudoteredinibacter sp.]